MSTQLKDIPEGTLEFSRPLVIDSLRQDAEVSQSITATPGECSALAKRFHIGDLSGLKAKIRIFRDSKTGIVSINGKISAKISQNCVISLENLDSELESEFETSFSNGKELIDDENCEFDLENDDFSPIKGGAVDLGELVAQYLSLEIDPHPRKDGVAFEETSKDEGKKEGTHNPFKALGSLLRK